MHKSFQYILGISLIAFGIAVLFLPVVQGVLLILAGLVVLRMDETKGFRSFFRESAAKIKGAVRRDKKS